MGVFRASDVSTPPTRNGSRLIYRVILEDGREGSVSVEHPDRAAPPASAEWVADALNQLIALGDPAEIRVGLVSGALVLRWVGP